MYFWLFKYRFHESSICVYSFANFSSWILISINYISKQTKQEGEKERLSLHLDKPIPDILGNANQIRKKKPNNVAKLFSGFYKQRKNTNQLINSLSSLSSGYRARLAEHYYWARFLLDSLKPNKMVKLFFGFHERHKTQAIYFACRYGMVIEWGKQNFREFDSRWVLRNAITWLNCFLAFTNDNKTQFS